MSEALKPCPFCGEEPKRRIFNNGDNREYWIVCDNEDCSLNVSTVFCEDKEDSITAWNTRAEQPTINTFEEQLKIALKALNTINDVKECREEQGLAMAEYFNHTAQKALEEITALKDNLGGSDA